MAAGDSNDAQNLALDKVEDGSTHEEFKEVNEVRDLIGNLKNIHNGQIPLEISCERFTFIMDDYQEQPHLLDPHLESLLSQLLGVARNPESPPSLMNEAFKYLYLITKVCGYKRIVRLMPHEVADLEPALALLMKQKPTDYACWETRYMLLLWLSIVCMIPFDMVRFDSNAVTEEGEVKKPIMDRILEAGKIYLNVPDKTSDAAAYMVSRFLTRHDVKNKKLAEFVDWMMLGMSTADQNTIPGVTAFYGVLTVLASLLKFGKREDLLPYTSRILESLLSCKLPESNNSIIRKYGVKIIQRLALIFLKQRVAAWRYQRGSRSLADNLQTNKTQAIASNMVRTELADEDEDEDYDIPEEIEEIIEHLRSGLRDKDTIVRWSAAKGVGRVTGRLPEELADEVVGSLLELFSLQETDGAWHGGCLALAELGRRGLLLPKRLPDVIPIVLKALAYDEKRGYFSVGAHVRDAACYVCWAFARAYDPEEIKDHVNKIAGALVVVSIFDREVNVRRAASAAFQENVGRQGTFPHGIDILTMCDYFAVGNRNHCYLELSVYVAQFEEYTQLLIGHLISQKVNHWDLAVRELTSKALHNLTTKAPKYMARSVLPILLEQTSSIDLNARHGTLLAIAEIIHALAKLAWESGRKIQDDISETVTMGLSNIAEKLHSAKLFRGLGGELMRKAICCLIQKLSQSKMPYHGQEIIGLWQEIIDDCLHHIEPEIQQAAADAIPAFFSEYYKLENGQARPDIQEKIIEKYLEELRGPVQISRMGFSLAIGSMPKFMISGKFRAILNGLLRTTIITEKEKSWAESRRDAVKAVTSICCTMGVKPEGPANEVICEENICELYEALLVAMRDYTLDSRGDVGAWVREASMTALLEITSLVVTVEPRLIQPAITKNVFSSLVQQSCEKIDRTRAHAGECFFKLLYHIPAVPHIPHEKEVKATFPKNDMMEHLNWAAPVNTFPKFTNLLTYQTYRYSVLLGLTVSVGGLTESLVKHSSSSLTTYLKRISSDRKAMNLFSSTLLQIFKDHLKVDRVSIPLLKMLDQLLVNNVFDGLSQDESCTLPMDLLKLCQQEISQSGNPNKLIASADVFCGLLQFSGKPRKIALSQLLVFLCHKYPRLRKTTADKLYEAFVTYDGIVDDENLDDVLTILSEVNWDEDIKEVRTNRNELCDLLSVPKPVLKSSSKKSSAE